MRSARCRDRRGRRGPRREQRPEHAVGAVAPAGPARALGHLAARGLVAALAQEGREARVGVPMSHGLARAAPVVASPVEIDAKRRLGRRASPACGALADPIVGVEHHAATAGPGRRRRRGRRKTTVGRAVAGEAGADHARAAPARNRSGSARRGSRPRPSRGAPPGPLRLRRPEGGFTPHSGLPRKATSTGATRRGIRLSRLRASRPCSSAASPSMTRATGRRRGPRRSRRERRP